MSQKRDESNESKVSLKAGEERKEETSRGEKNYNGLMIEKKKDPLTWMTKRGNQKCQKVMLLYSWDMSNNFCRSEIFTMILGLQINIVHNFILK